MSDPAEDDDTALNLPLSTQSDDIPAEDVTDASAESDNDTDYSAMTVAALRSLAKNKGLTGYSTMNKDELIALLSSQ